MTFLNADAKIATHAAVTTNVHGTGVGNVVVGDDEITGKLVPTGALLPHGGGSAPTGFLLCDGAAVSRTTYSDLFAVVGVLFGIGDGSTTFNLPDMQGNVPVGIGASGVTNLGDVGGEQTHTLISGEMPAHAHSGAVNKGHSDNASGAYVCRASSQTAGSFGTASTGGDGAHQNMQPYIGTEYVIKT